MRLAARTLKVLLILFRIQVDSIIMINNNDRRYLWPVASQMTFDGVYFFTTQSQYLISRDKITGPNSKKRKSLLSTFHFINSSTCLIHGQ